MARSQEEFRFACAVAGYLAKAIPARIPWSHFPAGENRSPITGARLKRMGLAKGWPDYIIWHDGVLLGLELKAGKGRASPEQVDVADRIIANAGRYALCRSLEDVQAALERAGVPLIARIA